MKKILIILAAMALQMAVVAQKSSLTCTLSGLGTDNRVVVNEARGGRLVPVDTVTLDGKGRFKLEREVKQDCSFLALGLLRPKSPVLHVMLLPKDKVTMDVAFDPASNVFRINSTKGSQNMEVYRKYNQKMLEAMADPTKRDGLADQVEQLIKDNSHVLMSAFLVTYFESAFEQYASLYRTVRDALIADYPDNDFVRHLDSKLRAAIVAGMDAPDIELPDRDGVTRRLSDLRGKVVLVDFWASWCRPCRQENPNVVRVYKQFHDKGFEIFSVSLDNNREAWLRAIEADGLVWDNHVSDLKGWSSAGGRAYGIMSIPATVLIGPDGKVIARNLRGAALEHKLSEILGK